MRQRIRVVLVVLCVGLASGMTPGVASAHVTVKQILLEKDEVPEVTVTTPNEDDSAVVSAVTLTAPAGFTFVAGEAKSGWKLAVSDQKISWSGGELPPHSYTTFSFRLFGNGDSSQVTLQPTFTSVTGDRSAEEAVPVDLAREVGGGSSDAATTDLVYVVAAGALVAFLLSTVAFFVALRVWLESPRKQVAA